MHGAAEEDFTVELVVCKVDLDPNIRSQAIMNKLKNETKACILLDFNF